ncbi:NTP/NDP exchange transporter [bacterium]|nr:NTP/NDP exchange transporter [bacterium]
MSNNTQTNDKPAFGKLRSFLWPIHNFELKKFVPMLILFFCIAFNYTILRDTKDTLVVTSGGAEAITFLKLWGVLPAAIIFMLMYSKLSNVLSKKNLFYASLSPFLIFFVVFAFILFPNREALHPTEFCDRLQASLPAGMAGLISMLRYWTFSIFYIMAELWGSVCLSLLFWGFANDITKVSESKRFYALFGLGANLSLIFAGSFIIWASRPARAIGLAMDKWQVSLYWLMGALTLSGIIILATFNWMQKNVMTDPRFYDQNAQKKMKKSKPKLGIKDSLKFLMKSKYLALVAILVLSYGMCINMIEVTWKSQLKLAYPLENDYSAFMGRFSMITGVVTMFMILFVGGNSIRKMGWRFSALITPVMVLITGGLFFAFMLFSDQLTGLVAVLGTSPLMLAVVFGMIQNILSKSAKYSLFDPTKEMTYIPLDQESKVKGKAAIDVVGARMGKSGGALIQSFLIVTLGSVAAMAPYVCVLILAMIGMWIFSAFSLDKLFKKAMTEHDAKEAAEAKETKDAPAEAEPANATKEEPAPAS